MNAPAGFETHGMMLLFLTEMTYGILKAIGMHGTSMSCLITHDLNYVDRDSRPIYRPESFRFLETHPAANMTGS
jgi:hypothetical protein